MTTSRLPAAPGDVVIETPSYLLVPIDYATAAAIVVGELSGLVCAPGWPTADTPDALAGFVANGDRSAYGGWLITRRSDGAVVGDCGWRGGPDINGDVEIGYGLAAPSRRQGIATEAIGALVAWIAEQPGVRRVVAEVLADNVPSRRLLERLGFAYSHPVPPHVWYSKLPGQPASSTP